MRFGAPAYDLASLLCDPYVLLPESLRRDLLAHYVSAAPGGRFVDETFDLASVERLVQALGAYGRLGALAPTRHFRRYIPAAVNELIRSCQRCATMPVLVEVLSGYRDSLPPTGEERSG